MRPVLGAALYVKTSTDWEGVLMKLDHEENVENLNKRYYIV